MSHETDNKIYNSTFDDHDNQDPSQDAGDCANVTLSESEKTILVDKEHEDVYGNQESKY